MLVVALCLLGLGRLSLMMANKQTGTYAHPSTSTPSSWDWVGAQVGSLGNAGYLEASSQIITPAGKNIIFFGRPTDLALDPSQRLLAVKHSHGLAIIDTTTGKMTQNLLFPSHVRHFLSNLGGNGFHGIAWEQNGGKLWLTDSFGALRSAAKNHDGTFQWDATIVLPGPSGTDASAPGGLAIDSSQQRLYITLSRNNTLGVVNLATKKLERQFPVGVAPFAVVLAGNRAFVSNWGGRHPTGDDYTAESSGTQTVIDSLSGVASTGTVSVTDLPNGEIRKEIVVGLHPSGMTLSPDGRTLYVANSNSDSVSVVDVARAEVTATFGVKPQADLPPGSAPNALATSTDGKTLFVANGGNNAIAVVDLTTEKLLGMIPTGWYPGAVVADQRDNLFVANLKGVGSRGMDFGFAPTYLAERTGGHNVYDYSGSVSIIPAPRAEELKSYTQQVAKNMRFQGNLQPRNETGELRSVPVPTRPGERSVFRHVLYIIKENRTYDQILGDMKAGNGDESLTMFGAEVTPNHHALASEFVLLDNFYCNGTLSADGHQWTDEGYATDYVEKIMGGFSRSYPSDGTDPIAYSPAGFIWDQALHKNLSFRIYGEFLKSQLATDPPKSWQDLYQAYRHNDHSVRFLQKTELQTLLPYIDWHYPAFDLRVPDVYRAQELINEIHRFEQQGDLPNLMVVQLGNDHTSGTDEGLPTPNAAVADNDLALGQIVEAVSKSKFWKDTVIFVVEDDAQDGVDHVDGHRTVSLVASAYTRRGYRDKTFYNQSSILRTIELILGLDPMTQFDLAANPMLSTFQERPDFSPYEAKQNHIPLDELNPKLNSLRGAQLRDGRLSKRMDFTAPDKADEETLNLILWHAAKGYNAPYPH